MTERTFRVTADEAFFVEHVLRRLAEVLGGEGVPDEAWWIDVDFGSGPEKTVDPRYVLKGLGMIRTALEGRIAQATWEARRSGMSWQAIASQLGMATPTVRRRYSLEAPRRRGQGDPR